MESLDAFFDEFQQKANDLRATLNEKLLNVKEKLQQPRPDLMGMFPGLNYKYVLLKPEANTDE